MLGLPGSEYHLKLTSHDAGSPYPAPTKDNLLVFYIPDAGMIEGIVARLKAMGYGAVEPENPYWRDKGMTIEDPEE